MAVKKPGTPTKSRKLLRKHEESSGTDFSALDSAVSELAQQTAALLGDDKSSKPVLPKKMTASKPGPKSFDIVHPKQAGSNRSVLKASAPAQVKLAEPDEKLLEAGDDKPTSDAKPASLASSDDDTDSAKPKTVINHNPGSLHVTSKTPRVSSLQQEKGDQGGEESEGTSPELAKDSEKSEDETAAVTVKKGGSTEAKSEGSQPEPGEENAVDEQTDAAEPQQSADTDDDGKAESSGEPTNTVEVDDDKKGDEKPVEVSSEEELGEASYDKKAAALGSHADATQRVQLFSDNLEDKKDGEEGDPDEEKTDLFDTEQYHPKLHDWSKLEHHNNTPIVVLLILLLVFAAGVYVVVSGMKLPYIGS